MSQNSFRILLMISVLAFLLSFAIVTGAHAQAISSKKHLHVGELWHTEEDLPNGGWEISWCWPGNHWRRISDAENHLMNATQRGCGLCYGMKEWRDWKNVYYPAVVGGINPNLLNNPPGGRFGGVNHEFKLILRRPPPTCTVDGELQAPRQDYDVIDPNLMCDVMLVVRWSYDVGLTAEQRYYAYASPPYDSYMYIDYVVKNSGNVNRNEQTVELKNQNLQGVCFAYSIRPFVSIEGSQERQTGYEHYNDDWVEYYGENYADFVGSGTPARPNGNMSADSLRLFINWDGDNQYTSEDDTGDPDNNTFYIEESPGMGRLLSHQYFGMGFLHVDKSVSDQTNDLTQPYATTWRPGTVTFVNSEEAYDFYFSGKHLASPQEMGYTNPFDPLHVSQPISQITVGPYDMPFGSQVHFSMLVCVNGISYDLCNSVGLSWWTHWKGGPGMTDAEKNHWVATGKDSLFKYYSQATRRYFRNIEKGRDPYDVPEAPPAPDLKVTAGEKSVILEWSDVSATPDLDTGVNDFAGYRVYRAQGRNDTTFQKIWECGGKSGVPVTNQYVDQSVQRGFSYYYYVTAYDDGSQNWDHPGLSLESGKYWNMMLRATPVHPFMSSKPLADLNNVKVIPNPYHDKSVKFNWPGEENKLLFINLPLQCTIKIFTVTGDLVKTIHHDNGTTEEAWNQVSDDNQLIYSGVYIFHIDSSAGSKVGRFVVVRTSRIKK